MTRFVLARAARKGRAAPAPLAPRQTLFLLPRDVAMPFSPCAFLQCPKCGDNLIQTHQPAIAATSMAICTCRRCGCELPCVGKVIVGIDSPVRLALLGAILNGDESRAMRLILDRHAPRVQAMQTLGMRLTFNRFVRHWVLAALMERCRLRQVLERLGDMPIADRAIKASQFNLYLRHRFSAPSFLSTIPLLGLLVGKQGLVLDAPCGMGHLSYRISRLIPQERIVCMDLATSFAYATRRFFVPEAAATIVHDLNDPLPLRGDLFSVIFCSDAFHYVANKQGLAMEFMRLLRDDDGVLVIPHLHNRLQYNPVPGCPLSPAEYAKLFDGYHVRLFPEEYLVESYLTDRPLDLAREFTPAQLNDAPALVLVAAKSPDALGVIPNVREELLASVSNPRLSGLYQMHRNNGHITFRRQISQSLIDEYPEFAQVLPEKVTISADSVLHEDGRLRFDNEPELLRQHVLVDVPDEY